MSNRRAFACLPVVGLVAVILSGCGTSPEPVAAEDTVAPAPVYVDVDDSRITYDPYPDAPAPWEDLSSVDWFDPRLELVIVPSDIDTLQRDVEECEAEVSKRTHNLNRLWVIDGPASVSVLACAYAKGHGELVLTREVAL